MLLLTHVLFKGWLTSKETSYKAMMISEDKANHSLILLCKMTEGFLELTTVIVNLIGMRCQLNV